MPGKFDSKGFWRWSDGRTKPVTAADLKAECLAPGTFKIGDTTGLSAGTATLTSGGIARIKPPPWQECGCICHKTKHRVTYLNAKKCCTECPVCQKRIAGNLSKHLEEAHNASRING